MIRRADLSQELYQESCGIYRIFLAVLRQSALLSKIMVEQLLLCLPVLLLTLNIRKRGQLCYVYTPRDKPFSEQQTEDCLSTTDFSKQQQQQSSWCVPVLPVIQHDLPSISSFPQLCGNTISRSVQSKTQTNGKGFLRFGSGPKLASTLANQNGQGLILWLQEQVVEMVPVHTSSFSFPHKELSLMPTIHWKQCLNCAITWVVPRHDLKEC